MKSTQYQIQLKDEMSAQLRNIEGRLKETNDKMTTMGKSGAGAFDALTKGAVGFMALQALGYVKDFGIAAVKAFGDMEEKTLRLNAQLRVSGNQLGLTAQQVMAFASSLESVTGIDDSDLLDAIATMQTFGNVTGETFKEAITQAANMSVVFGDVDTAAKQLGAALENPSDNLDKLKKASVYFTDAEKEQIRTLQESGKMLEAQGVVLDKIKGKFDGLAETVNGGVNGSMRNLSNAWDDTMKGMGQSFATFAKPAMDALTNYLNDLNDKDKLSGLLRQMDALDAQIKASTGTGKVGDRASAVAAGSLVALKEARENLKRQFDALFILQKVESTAAVKPVESGSGTVAGGGGGSGGGSPAVLSSAFMTGGNAYFDMLRAQEYERNKVIEDAKAADDAAAKAFSEWAASTGGDASGVFGPFQGEGGFSMVDEIEKVKITMEGLTNTATLGWDLATSALSRYMDTQAEAAAAEADRLRSGLEEYITDVELRKAIGERAGEDMTQFEIDAANEIHTRKKALAEADKAAKLKAWEANKSASITQAIMDGVNATIKAYSTLGPILGPWAAGAVGLISATGVGTIMSQQPPAFAGGGIVPGASFAGDNVLARLNSGEMVLNTQQQSNLFAQINGGRGGGVVVNIERVYGTVDDDFLNTLERSQELRSYRGIS